MDNLDLLFSQESYEFNSKTISLNENETFPFTERAGIERFLEIMKLFDIFKENKDKKRKEKPDNIRKKIKAYVFKILKKIINKKLKDAGVKNHSFESLPQSFIADVTLKTNNEILHLSYEEIFEYSYQLLFKDIKKRKYIRKNSCTKVDEEKNKKRYENNMKIAKKKYEKNNETLSFLNSYENHKICKESGWDIIGNMKFEELLRRFFNSKEFEDSIKKLEKKESKYYICEYIYFAKTYLQFYQSYQTQNPTTTNEFSQAPEFSLINNRQRGEPNFFDDKDESQIELLEFL